MELCKFGCNQEAKYQFKNGVNCCSKYSSQCPEIKKRNSEWQIKSGSPGLKKSRESEIYCKFCNNIFKLPHIKKHEKLCYLNPKNLSLCPVCDKPIKNYLASKTCSNKCSKIFFKEKYDNSRKNRKDLTYIAICFFNHKKECVICGELNIVSVHHYDMNHKNNSPENLIPMCPTHHQYMHSKFKKLINDEVEKYRNNWIISQAPVAQMVEQGTCNALVEDSNSSGSSK